MLHVSMFSVKMYPVDMYSKLPVCIIIGDFTWCDISWLLSQRSKWKAQQKLFDVISISIWIDRRRMKGLNISYTDILIGVLVVVVCFGESALLVGQINQC